MPAVRRPLLALLIAITTLPAIHAAQRCDELMANGDTEGWSIWKRICAAVDELLRDELAPGERRH